MEIGIVTCEKCPTLSASDRSLIPAFQEAGATATPLVWNDPAVNWSSYDFLLIRSIWDYHLHPAAFVRWINRLEEEKIITLNPVSVMRRNYHKFYLRELEASGVRIIPTLFLEKSSDLKLPEGLPGWNKVVIKPAISASGYMTRVHSIADPADMENKCRQAVKEHDVLVQQFMPSILEDGELSLIYIDRIFSHAIRKTPVRGEFRVQSEYGGSVAPDHPDQAILAAGEEILRLFEAELLYARVDGLVIDGVFVLMEVELIEPELFLDAHPGARHRMVDAAIRLAAKKNPTI
ncbi:MAG: hypothetical protein SH819_04000 [Cytophagales bacterium]|nr:hypothetical protein [Cytophagales bacterium]